MKKCKLQFWIFIISVILRCGWTPVHAIEPVTTGVLISGALASIFAGYKHLTSRVQESCTSEWIQPDVHKGNAVFVSAFLLEIDDKSIISKNLKKSMKVVSSICVWSLEITS